MEPAHSIGRLGFRRWYERQLLESHAWLVTCLLSGFAIFAFLEGASFREALAEALVRVVLAFGAGLLSWYAFARYASMLARASRLAEHSTCAKCGTYGRFQVLDETGRIRVRCRQCAAEWQLG